MADERTEHDVVIIGSGPAGLSAAIYAGRANLNPLVVEGLDGGGQLAQAAEVENYPGFAEPQTGASLVAAMRRQAERCGARFLLDDVQTVALSEKRKTLTTTMNGTLAARAVIVCTGAAPRWTGLPGESRYRNRGVSACATCDGALFRDRDVAVIGGGDTALSDALALARLCRTVTVVHRRDRFRASKALEDRVRAADRIRIRWNAVVEEFLGDGTRLSGLRVRDVPTGAAQDLAVAGAFVAIGHAPGTRPFEGQLALDAAGCIAVDRQRTSVPGVFAAGDCADPFYRQAVVAAGAGAAAALEAERFLRSRP